MSYMEDSYKCISETLKKNFARRGIDAFYCPTKEEAKDQILSMIPKGSSVTWGGTESMREAGVCDAICQGEYEFIDRTTAHTPEEARALYGKIVCADYFLTGTNAFTTDGELVNIDGASNRVACIAHGPAHVIIFASMDKMCASVSDAYDRIRTQACPPNAMRLGFNTPCAKTGICSDCFSPDCICCQILVTRYSRIPGRITVILCGEKAGF